MLRKTEITHTHTPLLIGPVRFAIAHSIRGGHTRPTGHLDIYTLSSHTVRAGRGQDLPAMRYTHIDHRRRKHAPLEWGTEVCMHQERDRQRHALVCSAIVGLTIRNTHTRGRRRRGGAHEAVALGAIGSPRSTSESSSGLSRLDTQRGRRSGIENAPPRARLSSARLGPPGGGGGEGGQAAVDRVGVGADG